MAAVSRLELNIDFSGTNTKAVQDAVDNLVKARAEQEKLNKAIQENNELLKESQARLKEIRSAGPMAFMGPEGGEAKSQMATLKELIPLLQKEKAELRESIALAKLYTTEYQTALQRRVQLEKLANEEVARINAQRKTQLANELKSRQEYNNLVLQMKKKEIEAEKMYEAAVREDAQRRMAYDKMVSSAHAENVNKNIKMGQLQSRALEENARRDAKNIDTLQKAWGKFVTVFQRVFDALVAFTIINWSQRLLTGFFKALISANQLIEETQARLEALIPTSDEIRETWTAISKITITTPFKIQDVSAASVLLRTFGVGIKENLAVVADWSTAVKRDLDDTAIAFAKIVNYSPRIALLLSTRGLSVTAFETYVKRFGDRTIALSQLIQDTFGGTAKRVSKTFEGLLSNINDAWVLLAQKIGEPLFSTLKSDLTFVFNSLQRIVLKNSEWLGYLGQIVSISTQLTVYITLVGIISLLVSKFSVLVTLVRQFYLASSTTILWVGLATAIIFTVFQVLKLVSATKDVEEAQKRLNSTSLDSHRKRIEEIDEIISGFEQQKEAWFGASDLIVRGWDAITGGIKSANAQLEIYKKIRADEQLRVAEDARRTLLLNAQVSGLEKYNLQQKIAVSGQKEFLESQIEVVENRKEELQQALMLAEIAEKKEVKVSPTETVSVEQAKDMIAFSDATAIYLKLLTGTISKEEALTEVQNKLTESFKNARTEEQGVAQTFQRLILTINEFVDDSSTVAKKADDIENSAARMGDAVMDLYQKIEGQQARFRDLQDEDSTNRTRIISDLRDQLALKNLNNKQEYEAFFKRNALSKEAIENEVEQLKARQYLTTTDKARKAYLIDTLKLMTMINTLLSTTKTNQERIDDLMERHVNNVLQLKDAEADLQRSRVQWYKEIGIISSEQTEDQLKKERLELLKRKNDIDNLILQKKNEQMVLGLTGEVLVKDELEIDRLRKQSLQTTKDLFEITKQLFALPSPTWGDALYKQMLKLRIETEKWRDVLIDTISGAVQSGLSNIFDDLITNASGVKDAERAQKMVDLQTRLAEEQLKGKELMGEVSDDQVKITVHQNEQLRIQQEINALQREQVSIIEQELLRVLDVVMKKLEDMAATFIVEKLIKLVNPTPTLAPTDIGTYVPDGRGSDRGSAAYQGQVNYSGLQRPVYNNSESTTVAPVIHFSGNVYGVDDFDRHIDKAMRNIQRNLV